MPQGIQEQIGTLATIEPELHFGEVGREMLCADFVPGLSQHHCGAWLDRAGLSSKGTMAPFSQATRPSQSERGDYRLP